MHLHAWLEWLMGQGWRDLGQAVLMGTAASWIALIFHELGHALAAWVVRVRMWGIRLGAGPTIWQGRVGACRVHVAALPFIGAVHLLDEDASAIGYRDIARGRWRFEWGPVPGGRRSSPPPAGSATCSGSCWQSTGGR